MDDLRHLAAEKSNIVSPHSFVKIATISFSCSRSENSYPDRRRSVELRRRHEKHA